jgi:hypothetical protein
MKAAVMKGIGNIAKSVKECMAKGRKLRKRK